jgi:hypothetical protein
MLAVLCAVNPLHVSTVAVAMAANNSHTVVELYGQVFKAPIITNQQQQQLFWNSTVTQMLLGANVLPEQRH